VTAGSRGALSRFVAADGFFISAGLAFFFLVSLIPILLLGVSLVGFVLSGEEAARHVIGQLAPQFPVYQNQIARALLAIVETRAASGVLGIVVLVFFSTPMISAARLILHRLLGVRSDAGFLRNLLRDAAMALVLSVLLFTVSTVTWLYHWLRALAANALRFRRGSGSAVWR
jgi:membrane protein